jgi:hypothetical protein
VFGNIAISIGIGKGVMTTGKKAASDAARILASGKGTKKEREIAASDLAQAKKQGQKKS